MSDVAHPWRMNPTPILLFGFLIFGLLGCQPKPTGEASPPPPEGVLTPYWAATPTIARSGAVTLPTVTPPPTPTIPPTATPIRYFVVAGDTLGAIALRYAIPLDTLIAANPGIDPNFLTIGLSLTIPPADAPAQGLPTVTPVPITLQPPRCYPQADGGLQCLAGVVNHQPFTVENIAVRISLHAASGEELAAQTATSPLNLLASGQQGGVSATFGQAPPGFSVARAELLTAISVAEGDARYLLAGLQSSETRLSAAGLQAHLTGTVVLPAGQPEAQTVWLAAFAYDQNENLVGIRKMVAGEALLAGELLPFELTVYSLGPPIQRVTVLVEARP